MKNGLRPFWNVMLHMYMLSELSIAYSLYTGRPFLGIGLPNFAHISFSWAVLIHVVPSLSIISWRHLIGGLPLFLLCPYGVHSVSLFAHVFLLHLAKCPAYFIFSFRMVTAISLIPVFSLIVLFLTLSLFLIPSRLLSIPLCVILRLLHCLLVNDQV